MAKKGGGAPSTAGLEEATKDAIDLQRQMYEQGREDVQPWYDYGGAAVGKLSDLLGLSGGSVQTRQQIYDELAPQYTTQEQYMSEGGDKDLYIDPHGNLTTNSFTYNEGDTINHELYRPAAEQLSRDVINYDALNAAVDERLAGQETPSDYGSLLERFDLSKFEEDAGYQFRQQEAQKALERSMAAQGATLRGAGYGSINPNVARALEEQRQGLASQEYQNAYSRYVGDQMNTYNMLTGSAGMGQGSNGLMAQGAQNYANNVGNLQTGLAGAQYQADMARASQPSMFSNLLGAGVQLGSAYLMSDIHLKENVKHVGEEKGHKIYEFNYLDDDIKYRGVMAQDIIETNPEAIQYMPSGYMAVNYDALGLKMERV